MEKKKMLWFSYVLVVILALAAFGELALAAQIGDEEAMVFFLLFAGYVAAFIGVVMRKQWGHIVTFVTAAAAVLLPLVLLGGEGSAGILGAVIVIILAMYDRKYVLGTWAPKKKMAAASGEAMDHDHSGHDHNHGQM